MTMIEEVCTITSKGQTTVPKAVRQALGVGYGGRIAFRVEEGGAVTVHALQGAKDTDPALAPFLALLEADLTARPADAVRPLPDNLTTRLEALAAEVGEVDPDAPIEGEVSL
ncbi:MAG: AbrB family transcriptional regulator [Acetobacteraceae bacterium]|nr:MAG: AbrB family transcriptional regulator [Acetobacteraceae bacterium]